MTDEIEQRIQTENEAYQQQIIKYLDGYLKKPCSSELNETIRDGIKLFSIPLGSYKVVEVTE